MRGILSLLVFLTFLYNGQAIASTTKPLSITAQSWLVADEAGNIIQSENVEQQRSIASITKLMTAMVVLDANQNLQEQIGKYTRAETIQLALVHSDNKAAEVLCQHYPNGKDSCIRAMNAKAHQLGMVDTKYVEPTGLSVFNVSTATDLVKLVIAAKQYSEIIEAAHTPQVKIKIKKRWIFFNNTNPIIGKRHEFIVSKTGYIRASGGCIAMMLDTDIGRRIVIVLGSKNTYTRIPEAEFIATNY
jgi:D-alanyl-D-alanine endopeptidase (penicillin-binding protein 7)